MSHSRWFCKIKNAVKQLILKLSEHEAKRGVEKNLGACVHGKNGRRSDQSVFRMAPSAAEAASLE